MKYCIECKESYSPTGREQTCSLKCRLLSKIEKKWNGCWIFKGNSNGPYGKVRWKQAHVSAHRASYTVFKGEVPEGKWVCHKCDVPKCINPEHLFIGSASENRKDAVVKKRIPLGEKNHFAKLTNIQVLEMIKLKQEGFTYERLARIFNFSFAGIYRILKKKFREEIKNAVQS